MVKKSSILAPRIWVKTHTEGKLTVKRELWDKWPTSRSFDVLQKTVQAHLVKPEQIRNPPRVKSKQDVFDTSDTGPGNDVVFRSRLPHHTRSPKTLHMRSFMLPLYMSKRNALSRCADSNSFFCCSRPVLETSPQPELRTHPYEIKNMKYDHWSDLAG